MTFTQYGLLADIVGFSILAIPSLFWKRKGIPFLPTVWEPRWWLYMIGVLLVIFGFGLQFFGTFT